MPTNTRTTNDVDQGAADAIHRTFPSLFVPIGTKRLDTARDARRLRPGVWPPPPRVHGLYAEILDEISTALGSPPDEDGVGLHRLVIELDQLVGGPAVMALIDATITKPR